MGPFWTEQLALFGQHGGMMQIGPTCVSNSLSLLTFGAARPEEFQGPASGVNTQDPVTWSQALKRHGKKLAYTSSDTRRFSWYVPELLRLHDVFTVSYYTGDVADFTADPNGDGFVCGSHIVVVAGGKLYALQRCNQCAFVTIRSGTTPAARSPPPSTPPASLFARNTARNSSSAFSAWCLWTTPPNSDAAIASAAAAIAPMLPARTDDAVQLLRRHAPSKHLATGPQ